MREAQHLALLARPYAYHLPPGKGPEQVQPSEGPHAVLAVSAARAHTHVLLIPSPSFWSSWIGLSMLVMLQGP